jgi:hypothetical protein
MAGPVQEPAQTVAAPPLAVPDQPAGVMLSLGAAPETLVSGQEKAEGFTQSNVKLVAKDSGGLPKEVRDFVAGFDAATGNTNAAADAVAAP